MQSLQTEISDTPICEVGSKSPSTIERNYLATILTHPIIPLSIGLLATREQIPWRLILVGMLCAMIPDADVLAFKFGVEYASPFGHRGFTHSLVFAAGLASIFCIYAKTLKAEHLIVWLFCFIATASHPILDAFTNGGLGVAFYWPFNQERFFFAQRFIEVSPIGIGRFFSERGLAVIQSELQWIWLPCSVFVVSFHFIKNLTQGKKN